MCSITHKPARKRVSDRFRSLCISRVIVGKEGGGSVSVLLMGWFCRGELLFG